MDGHVGFTLEDGTLPSVTHALSQGTTFSGSVDTGLETCAKAATVQPLVSHDTGFLMVSTTLWLRYMRMCHCHLYLLSC